MTAAEDLQRVRGEPEPAPDRLPSVEEIVQGLISPDLSAAEGKRLIELHIALATGTLIDTFASMVQVPMQFDGLLSPEIAALVMGEAPPARPLTLGGLEWYAEAEARLRYIKADAMSVARRI